MDLMELQKKAIYAAVAEGTIEAVAFAAQFSLDAGATAEALADLRQQGFMRQGEGGRYSLTASGEALHERWERRAARPVRRRNT